MVWASLAAGASGGFGRGRAGPFSGNDRVELRPQQLLLGAQQLEELLIHAGRQSRSVGSRALRHRFHLPAQALMACRSPPLLLMEILRGLACAATGISKVSSPLS